MSSADASQQARLVLGDGNVSFLQQTGALERLEDSCIRRSEILTDLLNSAGDVREEALINVTPQAMRLWIDSEQV